MNNEFLPAFSETKPSEFYEASGSTTVAKIKNATVDEYESYLGRLTAAGFEEYTSNIIMTNRFATFIGHGMSINCSYFPSTGIARVISEPLGKLPPREADNLYTDRGLATLLTGVKIETVVAAEGMGYVLRLCDGSFIIIDGGMGDPDHRDSTRLLNILKDQSPDETPIIAAWLFTHLHGDHVGVFDCFSIDYHDRVKIEMIVCNFPTEEEIAASDSPYMLDDSIYRYNQFKKCLAEYYPDVPVVKPHTGNVFHVRNAKFEILATLDELYPDTIATLRNMNSSTTLYKMTLCGQTILWTGDIDRPSYPMAMNHFGTYLKADILQLAHHSMNGTPEFYALVDPTVALLPIWENGYKSLTVTKPQNQWLMNSPNMKHLIDTSKGTWSVTLPYLPIEGMYDRLPEDNTVNPPYIAK